MARRASSATHPFWIAGAVLLLIVAIAGGYFLYQTVSDPYRTLTSLDVESYLENANSLRGNVYKIDATIQDSLAWSPSRGRLFSVEVKDEIIPLLIPAEFNHLNIQKGQRFNFRVEIGDHGVLRAQAAQKV
jgi:hypothetical protein